MVEKNDSTVVNIIETIPVHVKLNHVHIMDIKTGVQQEGWVVTYSAIVQDKEIVSAVIVPLCGASSTPEQAIRVAASRSGGLFGF